MFSFSYILWHKNKTCYGLALGSFMYFLLSQSMSAQHLIFRGSDVMIAANFGLTKLHLVIAEDITVPGDKIFSGFYNNGTLSYISVTNADGSAASGTVSFNAVAFGE